MVFQRSGQKLGAPVEFLSIGHLYEGNGLPRAGRNIGDVESKYLIAGRSSVILRPQDVIRPTGPRYFIVKTSYAVSSGFHFVGFFCQAIMADSLHPTRPGEITIGRGNSPTFIDRQIVECESDVTSTTSFSGINRSNLLT